MLISSIVAEAWSSIADPSCPKEVLCSNLEVRKSQGVSLDYGRLVLGSWGGQGGGELGRVDRQARGEACVAGFMVSKCLEAGGSGPGDGV